jgi:7-cyano-7-deazaguanine synthase
MDSATLLAFLLETGHAVECVSFTYGSKHNSYEQQCAQQIADHYCVCLHRIDLTEAMQLFKSDLLKSGGDIPEGHYTAPSMAATVVPCRNMIFLSILAGIAESIGARKVAVGIHSGDHAIYPDCRPEFYASMHQAIKCATDGKVTMIAPFIDWDKTRILQYGIPAGVPYGMTRTCYKDQEYSCGVCGSCVERLEAFTAVGQEDPIFYEPHH